jgi:microcystin-dependent protein
MSDTFLAEVRIFPFGENWTPTGWARCDGQLMPLSQNTALFSLLGTMYGGDGKSTFALPDLQGSVAVHPDRQNNSPFGFQGAQGGSETVTLLQSEIPLHTHTLNAVDTPGDTPVPTNNVLSRYPGAYQTAASGLQSTAFQSLPPAGGDLPHTNMMPYLTMNYCIALQGIFPPRS